MKKRFSPRELFELRNAIPMDMLIKDGLQIPSKIRNDNGYWQKPNVIEFYDTGSRHMFILDAYFSESSYNSLDLFTQFLLSTPFPQKKIRIRPDNAKGFLNLKRTINALNLKHSTPNGFYMEPDFAKIHSPKDKAHLESSHRSPHNFEIRIIKAFENRIVKTARMPTMHRARMPMMYPTMHKGTMHRAPTVEQIRRSCLATQLLRTYYP